MEPQFELSVFAFFDWREPKDIERMSATEYADHFSDRVEYKRGLARECCGNGPDSG